MCTIGYGDYYPRTLSGRLVAFVLCVWGIIIVSLMVVSLTNYVQYDNKQKQADFMARKLNMKQEVREAASSLIGISWKCYYNYIGRKSVFKNIKFWYNVSKFRTAFQRLKNAKKELKNHIVECDVFDRFIVENDLIRNDIEAISDNGDEILKGAKKLASQVKSLMNTHSNNHITQMMGLVPKSMEKVIEDGDQSEISLDRFDCIFASQMSKSQGSHKSLKSPRQGREVESDEDIEHELSRGSFKISRDD